MVSTVTPGMQCIKFLLFIFNLIFWITGIVIIVIGAIVIANYKNYKAALERDILEGAPTVLIIAGCVVMIIAFFGCYGAIKENRCMIMTFGALLILIFLMEIGAGIAAYVFRNKLESNNIKKSLTDSLKNYRPKEDLFWNSIQHTFHCCGIDSPKDWFANPSLNGTKPDSCCIKEFSGCGRNETVPFYENGCYDKIWNDLRDNAALIGGVGIGIAFIEVLGIILACCLAKGINSSYETV